MLDHHGARLLAALLLCLPLTACPPSGDDSNDDDDSGPTGQEVSRTFTNTGDASLEGHTPRGFQGQGGGLFTGDNINGGFPDGDGVQIWLSLDLAEDVDGNPVAGSAGRWEVESAFLTSEHASVSGDPFGDLETLRAEEVVFDAFSNAIYDLEPTGDFSCEFGDSEDDIGCDIAPVAQNALDDGRDLAQLRIRFDLAGDGDGSVDLLRFFIGDSNATERGIFELETELVWFEE